MCVCECAHEIQMILCAFVRVLTRYMCVYAHVCTERCLYAYKRKKQIHTHQNKIIFFGQKTYAYALAHVCVYSRVCEDI